MADPPYDPRTAAYPSFARARRTFVEGHDTPRAFLERGLARVEAQEPAVQAFVSLDPDGARQAADRASERWRSGRPLSPSDGMPFAVKDCFDVQGLPTVANSALFADAPPSCVDAAHVRALRQGGAVVLGKTVTTELTMAEPGPTRNPWDLSRTPGGSSSGSAAAVAAGMAPVATGSQVRGSIIRPASICGVIGFKPTHGALDARGGIDLSPSLNHLGLLGGCLADVWEAAFRIAAEVGGDPGRPALAGPPTLPEPSHPARLALQRTAGWERTDDASKEAFAEFTRTLSTHVELLAREDGEALRAYEDATARAHECLFDIMLWEARWPLLAWREARPDAFSETMQGHIRRAEGLTLEDYARACAERERLRALHAALDGAVDGFLTLAHIGPGQKGSPKLGTPWYNDASSVIGAPSLNLPLLAVEGVPLGVQLMGFPGRDAALFGQGRWFLEAFGSPLVGLP